MFQSKNILEVDDWYDHEWGQFVVIDTNNDDIIHNYTNFKNIKKTKSIIKFSSVKPNNTNTNFQPNNITQPMPFIDLEKCHNFKEEDKIFQSLETIYNCTISIIITISFIYFISVS